MAPPDDAGTLPARLRVLDGLDRTVTAMDRRAGRGAGAPVPTPDVASQIVGAPVDVQLVLVADERGHPSPLAQFVRRGCGWAARSMPLEPVAQDVLLAGDGQR